MTDFYMKLQTINMPYRVTNLHGNDQIESWLITPLHKGSDQRVEFERQLDLVYSNSVWYHPKHEFLGICEGGEFYVEYYIDEQSFHYRVFRSPTEVAQLGWQYVGPL